MTAVLEHPIPQTPLTGTAERPLPTRAPRRPWKRIIIDTFLLITFVMSFVSLAAGSIVFHVVAGTAFGLMAIAHVALNRTWVRTIWRRRTDLHGRGRANAIVDSILTAGWIAITLSGFALWLGLVPALGAIHGLAAGVLVAATGAHLMLHRRWISRAVRGCSDCYRLAAFNSRNQGRWRSSASSGCCSTSTAVGPNSTMWSITSPPSITELMYVAIVRCSLTMPSTNQFVTRSPSTR